MARDIFHPMVREAPEKEGWKITHDPYYLRVQDRKYEVDLGPEQLFAAEKGLEKIAVEVKSFVSQSLNYKFHAVLGQYLNYHAFMELEEPARTLYLAVPKPIYGLYFQEEATKYIVDKCRLNLVIFDVRNRSIVLWIPK